MNILVASNGHKEFLSAVEVREQFRTALSRVTEAIVKAVVFADGGEGTFESIQEVFGGKVHKVNTRDALMRPREGRLLECLLNGKPTICIQASDASGTHLLKPHEQQPMIGTSYGVGEMIRSALRFAPAEIVIGLGGSSAVECGAGMAQALGVEFFDERGAAISPFPGSAMNLLSLGTLSAIKVPNTLREFPKVTVLCDVTNPLTGPFGYAKQYGERRGLSPVEIDYLEETLERFVEVSRRSLLAEVNVPSSSASGGLAAGLKAFFGADLVLGAEWLADHMNFHQLIEWADLVVVGEGCLDDTTCYGKSPGVIAQLARSLKKEVWAIVGKVAPDCRSETVQRFDHVVVVELKKNAREENIERLFSRLVLEFNERRSRSLVVGN